MNTFDFNASVDWLETQARKLIRDSARETPSGITVFPPQVGCGYEAFWLRDYSYMLETCADAFSRAELLAACRLFVNAIGESDGAGVDCIKFSGEAVYKPGYGSMGSKPVADGGQFTVDVTWSTWKETRDDDLLREVAAPLIRTLNAVPVNSATGLVNISSAPGEDRCPYGFTDTIKQRGDVLFCSLLCIQACERLAEMLNNCGRHSEASDFISAANKARSSINTVLWDDSTGLYFAATERCRQPDIWGSAFAVWLDAASPEQAIRISEYFKTHYSEICQKGQIRHLPGGLYWEEGCARDSYQNGAYWATPIGWFVNALALTDPVLARQTVCDMVADFRERGICEWVIGGNVHLPGYVASATLPLQGIRKLKSIG